MAGTYVRAGVATADGPARALLHRQSFRLYLCLYLGARDVAALPLRSADGLRLEVSYAGAVMVLFVFVIMLLNAGEEEQTSGSRVAILFGIPGMIIGSVLLAWVLVARSGTGEVALGALPGSPRSIARLLFRDFVLPFEVTSVLVLIAIMGAVVLAARPEAVEHTKKEG